MLSLLATPSPVPIIINMPESSGSPWWGVPAITATAVLFGALITFLSTRASDSRKAKRDIAERIMFETRAAGLEYIDSVDILMDFFSPPSGERVSLEDAAKNIWTKWAKFELFASQDALISGLALKESCFKLVLHSQINKQPTESIEAVNATKYVFINTLREASGVGELMHDIPVLKEGTQIRDDITAMMKPMSEQLEMDIVKLEEKIQSTVNKQIREYFPDGVEIARPTITVETNNKSAGFGRSR